MAGTILQSDLSVTINESISLNGVSYGNTMSKTFAGNGKVDQRIMTIAATEERASYTSVLDFKTVDAKGQVILADYSYFRITNTDDTNFITLQLYISAASSAFFKLQAGESFLLMSPEFAVTCEVAEPSLAGVVEVLAGADTASVDVEYVAVTKGGVGEEEE